MKWSRLRTDHNKVKSKMLKYFARVKLCDVFTIQLRTDAGRREATVWVLNPQYINTAAIGIGGK